MGSLDGVGREQHSGMSRRAKISGIDAHGGSAHSRKLDHQKQSRY